MRHRSRSRNYDSSERYKAGRSAEKYESSRGYKSKEIHSHYSTDKKNDTVKYKKTHERSRYDSHRDSESEDKAIKKTEIISERDYKTSKYDRDESVYEKKSRKSDDYTHSYKRRSVSSDASHESSKYKRNDEKSDQKKSYYKETKRSKLSRSLSSEHKGDGKIKHETKDKKDKKIKKKSKKNEKEKDKIDKKKKKKQKHLTVDDKTIEIKLPTGKSVKKEPLEELNESKNKIKVEPFKVKEASTIKSQINVLNSSNIFTKDEWQKEASGDEIVKKKDSIKIKHITNEDILKKKEVSKAKHVSKDVSDETLNKKEPSKCVIEAKQFKEEKVVKKIKCNDGDHEELKKKNKHKDVNPKIAEKVIKSTKERDVEKVNRSDKETEKVVKVLKEKVSIKISDKDIESKDNSVSSKSRSSRRDRSHSHTKSLLDKQKSNEYKDRKIRDHKTAGKSNEDRKRSDEYLSEDERLELPRTPTDAQFAGLFTRLSEESISDTDIEDILPPMLLEDRMNALLDNDPNGAQEAWDSEDDVLLNKRENIIAPKHRGVLETLSVPWKILIEEASLNSKNIKNESMCKYEIPNILTNIGVSYKLAGEVLWKSINEKYSNVFLSPIAPIHQNILSQKNRRNTIFRERALFAGAISARKDFFIRRVLIEPSV